MADIIRGAALLALASEPTRLEVLLDLADRGPRLSRELIEGGGRSPRTTRSSQVRRLERSGLIEGTRRGRHFRYELTGAGRLLVEVIRPLLGPGPVIEARPAKRKARGRA